MKKERLKFTENEALTEWQGAGFDYIETEVLKKLQASLLREIERREKDGEE